MERYPILTPRQLPAAAVLELAAILRRITAPDCSVADRVAGLMRGVALHVPTLPAARLGRFTFADLDAVWRGIAQAANPPRWFVSRARHLIITDAGRVAVR
jgi:hypothetical protein